MLGGLPGADVCPQAGGAGVRAVSSDCELAGLRLSAGGISVRKLV